MWKILVVDDDFITRKLTIEMLKEQAMCDTAANGKEAMQAYQHSLDTKQNYDLILLDVSMPEIDGLGVLRLIREQEKEDGVLLGEGIPIIIVTAYKKTFTDAFTQGCDDYLLKPLFAKTLIEKITAMVG
ncbi:MAG: response regulator [Candidatus Omnitrophota bacterium]|nr:MAG: response regulator [Candidatus Omnitrophota bacterium]